MSVKTPSGALGPTATADPADTPAPPREPKASRRTALGRGLSTHLWMLPGGVVLLVLIVVPLVMLVYASFTSTTEPGLSLGNYAKALTDPLYLGLYGKSLWTAVQAMVLAIALGWPTGWAIAKVVPPRRRTFLLSLAIIPFLTSQLMLIYSMMVLIADNGPVVWLLRGMHLMGLVGQDGSLLYTPRATLMMLVYESLPMILLVLYAAAERIDDRLLEAAYSMGASRLAVFFRIILPLSAPSLVACFVLAFIPAAGSFVEATTLGGPSGQMIGNVIADQIGSSGNAPLGAALSLVLLLLNLVIVSVIALPTSGLRDRIARRRTAREA
jgi:spermidine/putrescine transport system permease protein